jgi:two-component system sensor histidine kinase CreC
MNIAIRLFLGFFLVVGVAAWFVLNIFSKEVQPGVRQAAEDVLVDTANLLAELAAPELAAGAIADGPFSRAVVAALDRSPNASIWGVPKESVDLRVYVTDATGIVVFDSTGDAVGADYSQWLDVARALRGEYGARSTRDDPQDPQSSVMYVAAPVRTADRLIGVVSVARPTLSLEPYTARAARRVRENGLWLLALSAGIGLLFTLWLTWSLNRLRDYARAVAAGERAVPPAQGGRQLSELARALAQMREKLDGKQYVETYVQNLAHELKSPLSAIRGAAEVLRDDPPAPERERFVANVEEQAERMQLIIERLLALARVEQLQRPEDERPVQLLELARETVAARQGELDAHGLRTTIAGDPAAAIRGDPFLLRQALSNLIDNAIGFSPEGGSIEIAVQGDGPGHSIEVRDHGPGAPDYALPKLFERFYSLPRPATGRKSTGLGLAFVREVARLHGGEAHFANAPGGGAIARLVLPR